MLRIAICDDDVQDLENSYLILLDFFNKQNNTEFKIRRFQSSYDLMECLDMSRGFHIYILDIVMPFMDGIELAKKIREKDNNTIIIFLTISSDYAVKSYEVYAFQYILKPVCRENLESAIQKALLKIDYERAQSMTVKTKEDIKAIRLHTIIFAEYIKHSVQFHLSDGSLVTTVIMREPFDSIANKLLKYPYFTRPHISYIVNMNFIRAIHERDFIMSDGSRVSISKANYMKIKNNYINYLLRGDL